eukprot:249767-Pyramimonas_sp.AAC.1
MPFPTSTSSRHPGKDGMGPKQFWDISQWWANPPPIGPDRCDGTWALLAMGHRTQLAVVMASGRLSPRPYTSAGLDLKVAAFRTGFVDLSSTRIDGEKL